MGLLTFVLYVTYLFVVNVVHITAFKQTSLLFRSANVGESVTLECLCQDDAAVMFYWYRQLLGKNPMRMCRFSTKNYTFQDEFNNQRFSLGSGKGKSPSLKISDLKISDSATYYCVMSNLYDFKFCEGMTVSVKGPGLNIQTSIQQSPSETIQPGGSVTLNCTLHSGTCDEDHSVYWFRDSIESHSEFIDTHGGRNYQCEEEPNTKTCRCVYSLPIKSLNGSHAGTYYCAVASWGHILFGEGTKLDIKDEVDSLFLVYVLTRALAFITIFSISPVSSLCMIIMIKTESRAGFLNILTKDEQDYQNVLRENKVIRFKRQKRDMPGQSPEPLQPKECIVVVSFLSGGLVLTTILAGLLAISLYNMNNRLQQHRATLMTNTELPNSYAKTKRTENLHYAALSDYKATLKSNMSSDELNYEAVRFQRNAKTDARPATQRELELHVVYAAPRQTQEAPGTAAEG